MENSTSAQYTVSVADAGGRLDAFLADKIEGWSRSQLQRLIDDGDVLVNARTVKSSYRLRENDEIEIDLVEVAPARFEPENIPLEIVFEDEHLAVINKPAGMVVHPGAGIQSGTLANAIAYHFDLQQKEPGTEHADKRVGIVHRLDKDTSGLIVVAKNQQIHEAIGEQFRERQVYKSYVTLVHGSPRENLGTIEKGIARDRWHRTKMTVAANGRYALSLWKVRQRFEKFTLLDVEIKTGRTHQIRVHLASINHPVVGDETYNEGRDNTVANTEIRQAIHSLGRTFLHAEKLAFTHPVTEERIDLTSPLPEALQNFLQVLK